MDADENLPACVFQNADMPVGLEPSIAEALQGLVHALILPCFSRLFEAVNLHFAHLI